MHIYISVGQKLLLLQIVNNSGT